MEKLTPYFGKKKVYNLKNLSIKTQVPIHFMHQLEGTDTVKRICLSITCWTTCHNNTHTSKKAWPSTLKISLAFEPLQCQETHLGKFFPSWWSVVICRLPCSKGSVKLPLRFEISRMEAQNKTIVHTHMHVHTHTAGYFPSVKAPKHPAVRENSPVLPNTLP